MEFTLSLIIVIATSVISISGFNNHKLMDDLIFYPPAIIKRKQWYRMITHGFIHADPIHLIFNMLALYSFGANVEVLFGQFFGTAGKLIFLLLYFSALIIASVPDLIKYRHSYHYRSLGASGAVSAVIFASILIFPTGGIGFAFIPGVSIPGYIFAVIYLIISSVLAKRGRDNIGHTAHITGAIYGLIFTYVAITASTDYDVLKAFVSQIKG
jgi:membrane associated rhomboid family serine protease